MRATAFDGRLGKRRATPEQRRVSPRPDRVIRLSDTNGDDLFDREEVIYEIPSKPGDQAAWNEHGVHAIVPGPDGKSFYIVAGDREGLPAQRGRTAPRWNQDVWGQKLSGDSYCGGWVMRMDLDGKNPEYICVGLRNSYDIAFNWFGDLFTYDSDLEASIGLPNYRPTAIRQILSGSDGCWGGHGGSMTKSLSGKYEEIQPPIQNIGPGSPTGVCFGYGAKFPARYQEAFFACDWSYGRLFAVHLNPKGASYTAEVETFLSAQGLPIADIAVSPRDGALYFVVGGRGTQSGLYRVTYRGRESIEAAPLREMAPEARSLRALRGELEHFHGAPNAKALEAVWPQLRHADRAIRGAARAALEWQPVEEWKARALGEREPRIALQSLLALVRCTDGQADVQELILDSLERLNFAALGSEERAWYLRILTLSAVRHGMYRKEVAAKWVARLEPFLPTPDRRVNEELVELSAALKSETFVSKALDLLETAPTQEEQMVYSTALIQASSSAWNPALLERMATLALTRVPGWKGGAKVKGLRNSTLAEIKTLLSGGEKAKFSEAMAAAQKPSSTLALPPRQFVKAWKNEDFAGVLEKGLQKPRDLEKGKALFAATGCIACHSFQGEGGLAGPDLTSAGGRYSSSDLLDNILNPSKVINEQYALSVFSMKDGSEVVGRIVNLIGGTLMVALNPMDPSQEKRIHKTDVKSTSLSPVSFMPEGLLNTLSEEDVLDLLAYMLGKDGAKTVAR